VFSVINCFPLQFFVVVVNLQLGVGDNDVPDKHATNTNEIKGPMPAELVTCTNA